MTSDMELEEPISHRVVPDGCTDIIFDLSGHSYRQAASVVGTMTKPIFAELKADVNYMAIRFLPGGFLEFFDSSAHNLTDRIIPLEAISGREEHDVTEQLVLEHHIASRIELLDRYLEKLLRRNNRKDPVAKNAIRIILSNKGNIRISELPEIVGCSERHLRRKFDRWLGVSPKVFCRIIRFQNVCRTLHHNPKCNLLSAALDVGYYDQSHFIHEFNSYYGLNPSEFVRK
jgi:AraC-like DNA-binding protein